MLILGGTIGATMVSFPMRTFLQGFFGGFKTAFTEPVYHERDVIATLVSFAEKARREGLLALENEAAALEDDFMRKGIQLVIASIRSQVFAPDAFTNLGMNLENARVIVVKSSHHFWAGFAPIAGDIMYVDSPGALRLDFADIPYKKRDANYWPRVEDPFA